VKFPIGIVAPSSKVPAIEFELGLERIREAGFEPFVHEQVLASHLFFAGCDEDRAQAIYDYACDPRFKTIWAARGGYGSMRLLPLLDQLTERHGVPPVRKLLAGFSDSTALLEYVRTRWGWRTLHAPMPGLRKFCQLEGKEWSSLLKLLRGEAVRAPWEGMKLQFIGPKPKAEIKGELVGGNLTVWTSLVGTPHAGQVRGKLVFFEDVDENLYRVDRMVQQLIASGSLKGARAIVLGNFSGCRDQVPQVLARRPSLREQDRMIRAPRPSELAPLRPSLDADQGLAEIFAEVTRHLGVPVARGLPVGHGPEKAPLPLGVRYSLSARGVFKRI
jgi:muramoyltetrapeptide carboxypeptidase